MSWGRVVVLDSKLGTEIPELRIVEFFFPLSDTRALGIPNLHTMERQTKLRTFFSVIVAKGSASAHLVK